MTKFEERVYKITSKIPFGKVTTYKAIAEILHSSPRAVGNALAKNPYAPKIPCHRVIRSNGEIGGYKGDKDGSIKEKMLKEEQIMIIGHKVVDRTQVIFFQ